eukprot:TRINITY_DN19366_c0_g1_i1.p1 TRINITY_DN19366_c0_g1~~TRINITY_DN19366_c0_g1_i1.p1  ORF type:complete len:383 (-),score=75.03 TRINITY_DN19366_c0_g1_i1:45-1193(-)
MSFFVDSFSARPELMRLLNSFGWILTSTVVLAIAIPLGVYLYDKAFPGAARRMGQAQGVPAENSQPQPKLEPTDLVRHEWQKEAITESTGHVCHLFGYVERQNGAEWGSFLDAGTGSHSLDWLVGLPTDRWVAVTGDPKRQRSMEKMFKRRMRPQDQVVHGNWKDPDFLKGQVFDVVLADYLLGSLDAYAPYFQYRLLDRLKPHVGKRLFFVGAEPFPDVVPNSPHGTLLVEIDKLRDACSLLAGERPYREYPVDWVLRNLRDNGFRITGIAFFETEYSQGFVETQLNVAESKVEKLRKKGLANTLFDHIDELRRRVKRMDWGVTFGHDYIICAEPIRDDVPAPADADAKEAEALRAAADFKKTRNNLSVEDQQQVFPRDHE